MIEAAAFPPDLGFRAALEMLEAATFPPDPGFRAALEMLEAADSLDWRSCLLQGAIGQVPGLLAQTVVPSSAVHDLLLDPGNQLRCAFHLGCGWSGAPPQRAGGIFFRLCTPAWFAAASCSSVRHLLQTGSRNLRMAAGTGWLWLVACGFSP